MFPTGKSIGPPRNHPLLFRTNWKRTSLPSLTTKPAAPALCRVGPLRTAASKVSKAARESFPARGCAVSHRRRARRQSACGLPVKGASGSTRREAVGGQSASSHASSARSSSSSSARERAAPATASRAAARCHAGTTRCRTRFRKWSSSSLLESVRQRAPVARSAASISARFRLSSGRTCTRPPASD